jgi:hypothetical protein
MRAILSIFLVMVLFSCKKDPIPDPPLSGYLYAQDQCAGKFLELRRTHPNEDPRQQLTVSYFIRYQGEPNYIKYERHATTNRVRIAERELRFRTIKKACTGNAAVQAQCRFFGIFQARRFSPAGLFLCLFEIFEKVRHFRVL